MIDKHQTHLVWTQLMEKEVTATQKGSSVSEHCGQMLTLLMPSARMEEQSAAVHLTYVTGCKDYLK